MKIYDLNKSLEISLLRRKQQLDKELPLSRSIAKHPVTVAPKEIKLELSTEARQLGLAAMQSQNIEVVLNLIARLDSQLAELDQQLSDLLDELIERFWSVDLRVADQTTEEQFTEFLARLQEIDQLVKQPIGTVFTSVIENLNPKHLTRLVGHLQSQLDALARLSEQSMLILPTVIEGEKLTEIFNRYPIPELGLLLFEKFEINKLASSLQKTKYLKHAALDSFVARALAGEVPPNIVEKSDLLYLIFVITHLLQQVYRQRLKLRLYLVKPISSTGERQPKQTRQQANKEQLEEFIDFVTECFLYLVIDPDTVTPRTISEQLFAVLEQLLKECQYSLQVIEESIYIAFLQANELYGEQLPQIAYDTLDLIINGLDKYV